MATQQAFPSSTQGSRQSTVEDMELDATADMSSTLATLYEPTKCPPEIIQADIELIATYLVKEKVPDIVHTALLYASE
jgi:hypothetical protein